MAQVAFRNRLEFKWYSGSRGLRALGHVGYTEYYYMTHMPNVRLHRYETPKCTPRARPRYAGCISNYSTLRERVGSPLLGGER
jgi:hypothetical protein